VSESVIRARCSDDLKKRVRDYAKLYDLDESNIVRQAVEAYLKQVETDGSITLTPKPIPPTIGNPKAG
jgi:predicted transcriptional regulator